MWLGPKLCRRRAWSPPDRIQAVPPSDDFPHHFSPDSTSTNTSIPTTTASNQPPKSTLGTVHSQLTSQPVEISAPAARPLRRPTGPENEPPTLSNTTSSHPNHGPRTTITTPRGPALLHPRRPSTPLVKPHPPLRHPRSRRSRRLLCPCPPTLFGRNKRHFPPLPPPPSPNPLTPFLVQHSQPAP